jgi:1-acyl-sn-glycerol-3-phosphate acyltransferase
MLKTLLIFAYFWLYVLFTAVFLPLWAVLRLTGPVAVRKRYEGFVVRLWAMRFIKLIGAEVTVLGRENVPDDDRVCFIGNHQSAFDILLIFGYSGKTPGFIAKKELMIAPVMNLWMLIIHCVFIARKNPRKSYAAMQKGIKSLKAGNPMAIFPEGTRSRNGEISDFKPGSFKLATQAGAVIVPVTFDGTGALYEETGRFRPGRVRLVFHPPIPTEGLSSEDKKELPLRVRDIVASGLASDEKQT